MSSKSAISLTKRQEVQEKAGQITSVLEEYLKPLVEPLDAYLDKRWVRTFLQGMRTLIEARTQDGDCCSSSTTCILCRRLMGSDCEKRWAWIMREYCHRTRKKQREAVVSPQIGVKPFLSGGTSGLCFSRCCSILDNSPSRIEHSFSKFGVTHKDGV
jgi:hypothetical protein